MSAGLDVEAVLAEHESYDYGGPGVIECACSWKSERLGPQWNGRRHERHRAHVAVKVREAVAAWLESGAANLPKHPAHWSAIEMIAYNNGHRTALETLAEQVRRA